MHRLVPSIVAIVSVAGLAVAAQAQAIKGPSTQQNPYLLPSAAGVQIVSIASNGNGTSAPNETYAKTGGGTYRLVGIPDGLGAYDNGDGTFTLLANAEIGSTAGVVRDHGSKGAFVSEWIINKSDLSVVSGKDLIQSVQQNNTGAGYVAGTTAFSRFCSADLAPVGAFYNAASGLGTQDRLFLNGEESGTEGRAMAHVATGASKGTSYELPWLGKMSFENAVANARTGDKTVVIVTDDGSVTSSNIYVYVGDKKSTGSVVDKAGLTGGDLYSINVPGATPQGTAGVESVANVLGSSSRVESAPFTSTNLGNIANKTGAQLQTAGDTAGQMNFRRSEDAAWNPTNKNQAFFVTTDTINGSSTVAGTVSNTRLWKIDFADATTPGAGGQLTMLLDGATPSSLSGGLVSSTGATGICMLDNLCVTNDGKYIVALEDVGNNARLGRVWLYDILNDSATEVAIHDAALFGSAAGTFGTVDEEASGVIDASDILGKGWFLIDTQAHYGISGELVEGGQLQALYIPQTVPTPGGAALLGAGGLVATRRRRA